MHACTDLSVSSIVQRHCCSFQSCPKVACANCRRGLHVKCLMKNVRAPERSMECCSDTDIFGNEL